MSEVWGPGPWAARIRQPFTETLSQCPCVWPSPLVSDAASIITQAAGLACEPPMGRFVKGQNHSLRKRKTQITQLLDSAWGIRRSVKRKTKARV